MKNTLYKRVICALLTVVMLIAMIPLSVFTVVAEEEIVEYPKDAEYGFDIPGSLYTMKEVLVNYFFDFSNSVSLFSVLNIVIYILSIALFAGEIIKRKLKFGNIIAICVCAILLPLRDFRFVL